jgi:valyl-tRNA synthetase
MGKLLEKVYNPHKIEDKWYNFWIENNFFHAEEDSDKKPFSIVIPPPNITGSLHMGHALNNTLQDIIARYKRMQGYNVLWMPGTDHAGIATQNVVERDIMKKGFTRQSLGREEFIKRIWKWKGKYGNEIINQLKRLGASCDWERERFTMDEGLSLAVKEVFVRLYEENLIYIGDYIINWCPRCLTALSDLEVEHKEVDGNLYYIDYPVKNSTYSIQIATTRPETMLGDTAVAVNPEDKRYSDFVGKVAILPIVNRDIPIIMDEYVDMDFGSGALKITPAHDPYDFEVSKRHNLDVIKMMEDDGTIKKGFGKYSGMDRFYCRDEIVKDLKNLGFLKRIEEYKHTVGHCYRCRSIVEPILSKQWFVKVKPLSLSAIEAVKKGKTRIIPKGWEKTYFEWMKNIKDWCISRQIWWGHRIPAWHCDDCKEITVAREEPTICKHCNSKNIHQDTDVLDTWFSSALWPFSTFGWPSHTKELEVFYPTSLLVTGFDILFFWVARMMMMGIKFMHDVPFRDVYIHALVRDAEGQKMSKSKGNVIDPLIIMDKYGTDAFRFTLAAFAAQGRDVKLSEDRIEGYRNFMNKLWNASRFSLMNIDDASIEIKKEFLSIPDKWILSRLRDVTSQTIKALDEYRFNDGAHILYQFVWHEFCDWYIEFIKPLLYGDSDPSQKICTKKVLEIALRAILRLLHPFIPFITEEIWQSLPSTKESLTISRYPEIDEFPSFEDESKEIALITDIISGIRNIRGEIRISPSEYVDLILLTNNKNNLIYIERNVEYIKNLAKVREIHINTDRPLNSATGVVKDIEIFVPIANIQSEIKRLNKEIEKIDKEFKLINKKLLNEDFIENAPDEIVEKERRKAKELVEKRDKLKKSLENIERI